MNGELEAIREQRSEHQFDVVAGNHGTGFRLNVENKIGWWINPVWSFQFPRTSGVQIVRDPYAVADVAMDGDAGRCDVVVVPDLPGGNFDGGNIDRVCLGESNAQIAGNAVRQRMANVSLWDLDDGWMCGRLEGTRGKK